MMEESSQEYEVLEKPCGFIYQLQLLSTWGDQYYVGLNGLEVYDGTGNLIQLTDNSKYFSCVIFLTCKVESSLGL